METSDNRHTGIISIIHHHKEFGFIEYNHQNRLQRIVFFLNNTNQHKLQKLHIIKEAHRFWEGDEVSFVIKKHHDDFKAVDLIYIRNEALDHIIEHAKTRNIFFGHLEHVNNEWWITEHLSEISFPLRFLDYELPPVPEIMHQKNIQFRLLPANHRNNLAAELINKNFANINNDMHHHLKLGTSFDAIILSVSYTTMKLHIPFFDIEAHLAKNNDNSDHWDKFRTNDRCKIKLHRVFENNVIVKLADSFPKYIGMLKREDKKRRQRLKF